MRWSDCASRRKKRPKASIFHNTGKKDTRGTLPPSHAADRASPEDIEMTKLEAVIQNSRLEDVKSALHEIGVEGMTVMEVRGHGRQKGHTEFYRGREYTVDLIPKIKIEMVLADDMVEKATEAIVNAARTG